MPSLLAERQAGFAAALLDRDRSVPVGLVNPDGRPASARFGVYRNNVAVGLVEALAAEFPAVQRIVGDEFFRAMARAHVAAEPPRSPVLILYGAGFPGFIAGFEPAASVPYLADVAAIERAWHEAYHAAEAEPLGPDAVAAVPPARLAAARLVLHPSVRVVRSRFPAVTIWRMNVADGVPAPVDLSRGEDALIVRPDAQVVVRTMPSGAAGFVMALGAGLPLGEAAAGGLADSAQFDLAGALAGLIAAGGLAGVQSEGGRE